MKRIRKKTIDTLRLLLSVEILTGCQFSCDGCFVNKTLPVFLKDDDLKILSKTIDSFRDNGYSPEGIIIGPTDFLVSDNTVKVMSDPRIEEIVRKFRLISLVTTTLNINRLEEISEVFKKLYSDKYYEINIIIEPLHIRNKKYINTLKTNKQKIREAFGWAKDIRHFGKMNVFNYQDTKIKDTLSNYDRIYENIEDLIETTIDFNFSISRREREITSEQFHKSIEVIKGLHDEVLIGEDFMRKGEYNFRYQNSHSIEASTEKHYIWRDGTFYYTPLMYEDFISFKPDFKIPVIEGDIKEFDRFEEMVTSLQYENLSNKEECPECPYLNACVSKGTLFLMDKFNMTSCPISRNWFVTHFDQDILL